MRSKLNPPDLRSCFPRSPRERIRGLVHLPRMIDKARAKRSHLLGEYLYPCPLDKMLLEFIGVTPEAFLKAAEAKEEDEIVVWLQQAGTYPTKEEIEIWNASFLSRGPEDEEGVRRFTKARKQIAPERSDICAWADLIDLDEGREVPPRTPL